MDVALTASTAALAALSILLYMIYRLTVKIRKLEEKTIDLAEQLRSLRPDIATVKRALGVALSSLEAERALELLRRRRRRRYIVFQVIYEGSEPPPPEEVEKAVIRSVERLAGQLTVALSRLQLVYYDHIRGVGIIRASHDTKYLVIAGMALVRNIGGRKAVVIPLRTTGTIRTAKRLLSAKTR